MKQLINLKHFMLITLFPVPMNIHWEKASSAHYFCLNVQVHMLLH